MPLNFHHTFTTNPNPLSNYIIPLQEPCKQLTTENSWFFPSVPHINNIAVSHLIHKLNLLNTLLLLLFLINCHQLRTKKNKCFILLSSIPSLTFFLFYLDLISWHTQVSFFVQNFFSNFLQGRSTGNKFPQSLIVWESSTHWIQNPWLVGFSSNRFKCFTWLFCLHGFWR